MELSRRLRLKPGDRVHLLAVDPAGTHGFEKGEELDKALEEIDQARASLREAGTEVIRAKREAAEAVTFPFASMAKLLPSNTSESFPPTWFT